MNKSFFLMLVLATTLYGCSTSKTTTSEPSASPPDTTARQVPSPEPVDFSTLLEPPEEWHHLDEERTRFRGISSRLAYETILKNRKPQREIIVAVIDGGVDAEHEDLKEVMWINSGEIPDNGIDDDQNGYVDDIHGWNFIGGEDGENIDQDTFELTRLYRKLHGQFADADTAGLDEDQKQKYAYYREIRTAYENRINELLTQYDNISSLGGSMKQADRILTQYFGHGNYGYEEVVELNPSNQEQQFAQSVMVYVMENDIDSTFLAEQKKQIYEFAKYGYNPGFSPRSIVGDNYQDKSERHYGNNDVAGPDPSHGTHVAGIVAAVRNNGVGVDGISVNTRIMAIRTVPDGDERDKDVANAIRYAVDNGADIINMSFGKSYSPHKEVVDKAVKYADQNGVLMVHGAGNGAKDTDRKSSYPTGRYEDDGQAVHWLAVGASSWKPGEEFVASFSNYGKETVDLFAPGVDIYSTMPDNSYEFQDGTSMASPVVAGTAALVKVYFPDLSARQIRDLLLENTVTYPGQKVILPNQNGAEEPLVPFDSLSVSNGVVNVYKALKAAEKLSGN